MFHQTFRANTVGKTHAAGLVNVGFNMLPFPIFLIDIFAVRANGYEIMTTLNFFLCFLGFPLLLNVYSKCKDQNIAVFKGKGKVMNFVKASAELVSPCPELFISFFENSLCRTWIAGRRPSAHYRVTRC